MITVERWTGAEATLLLSVKRESQRGFADNLGLSSRTVAHWRQNPTAVCRPATAQILDCALAQCSDEEKSAFRVRLAALHGEPLPPAESAESKTAPCTVVSHKFLPAYVGESLAPIYEVASPRGEGPGGLEQRVLPTERSGAQAATTHLYGCGVVVFHLQEQRHVESLTDLAVWRYHSYPRDRSWAGQQLAQMLGLHADVQSDELAPEYVLSAYELRENSWKGGGLETALHLLTTPSVLVNRQDPQNVSPLAPGVEDAKFQAGWWHPEAVSFGGGVSQGVAGWSGVAYHPQPDERALTMSDIVNLELDAQALWALTSHILHVVEDGRDPVMPKVYGWRYLRSAYVRLTTARPTESAQHRAMREAILSTSELPKLLRSAQEALRDSNP
ncbi:transcriptional regulator [Streptomyces nanshensis]|uniref:Cro/Cl family transcriptional regulator n=1 Tax=Streptomyces nanshensis TaxID=518642 RepID=A0A1E7L220_9ACTN|nr:transcriptional regulator [Streptomyces nanshensis]OEV10218.1 Cro/Cl family transcriptional regulator [Streptomyces nanshensis]